MTTKRETLVSVHIEKTSDGKWTGEAWYSDGPFDPSYTGEGTCVLPVRLGVYRQPYSVVLEARGFLK